MSTSTQEMSPCNAPDGPRPSRSTRWRAAVLIGVHVLFALHLAHLALRGSTLTPVEPSEAMEYSKHSVVNAGLVFFAAAILATLVFGRFFCGWGCHLVALQDLARSLLLRMGIRPKPLRSRALAIVPGVAFVYMFLWPVAYRLWIGDDFSQGHREFLTSDFWRTFPGLAIALLTFAVCGFAIVYFLGAKGFCTYACPYGAIFGAVDRVAPGRIRVTDACEGCGHCTATCTSNVLVHQEVRDYGMVVDAGCMKCMDCVSVCPKDALYFGFGKPGLGSKPRREPKKRRPTWTFGEEAFLAIAFLAAFLAFRGLYDAVPFLLTLGLAAIVAYASLLSWRLLRGRDTRLQNLVLRAGKLTGSGRLFAFGMLAFGAFWAHSGWIRYNAYGAQRAMRGLQDARARFMQPSPAPLDEEELAHLAALERHNGVELRYGLWPTSQAAFRAAWAHMLAGDFAGYGEWMERAVELDERTGIAAQEYASFLAATGDAEGAERSYRRALELTAKPVAVTVELAQFLAARQEFERALAVLDAALEEDSGSAPLHHMVGLIATARGDAPGAVAALRRAVALSPERYDFRERLATVLVAAGAPGEALETLREGPPGHPDSIKAWTAVGLTALSTDALAEAEEALRRALELDPEGSPEARQGLVRLLQRTGRGAEAAAWAAGANPPPAEPLDEQ